MTLFSQIFATTVLMAQEAAAAAPAKGPSMIEMLVMPIGFLVIMYFFIIRPQQRKAKEQADLITNLKVGDEIVTTGGIIGKVRSIAETFVSVEVSSGTNIKVLKNHVTASTKTLEAAPAGTPAKAKS